MAKYYEEFKGLFVAALLSGYYMSSIELIYGRKWYLQPFKCLFYFSAVSLPLYFVFSAKYVLYDEGEMGPKMYGVSLSVYCSFSAFLAYAFYFSTERFVKLFELWDSMFVEELFSEDRQILLNKNIRSTNRWLKIFGGASVFTSVLYCSATYFNEDKKLDHPIGIPYENKSPDFEFLNTFDLFCATLGFATLIAYDSMNMAFFCLEEAQFKHLKNSLAKIVDISVSQYGEIQINEENNVSHEVNQNDEEKIMKRSFAEMERKLKIWISHHQQILRFHAELQSLYRLTLSVKFFAFVIICCSSGFLLITRSLPLKDSLLAIAFCFNNYSIFYVNITLADSIRSTSESIFGEIFEKSWYLHPKKVKIAFKIILLRSNRPVRYVALWIYPIDSKTFLKILTSVYSLSTFLLQLSPTN